MQIRILGPIELHENGRPAVSPKGAKQRALLGALVVRMGRPVTAGQLVNELWGDDPPANAANALQAHVVRLRRLLETAGGPAAPRVLTHPLGYVLHAGPEATDAARFLRMSSEGRALAHDDPERALQVLRGALDLWHGPALAGCTGAICRADATQLDEGRLQALETLFDVSLRTGRHADVIADLEDLVAANPLRERLYDLLMLALYRSHRQAEALGIYERARGHLSGELGMEPGPALRARLRAVLEHDPELDAPVGSPAERGAPARRGRVRPSVETAAESPFDARQPLAAEIADLQRDLGDLARQHRDLTRRMEALCRLAGRSADLAGRPADVAVTA